MKPGKLEAGDIVQISPTACFNKFFGGCMMIVTQPKPTGAQGYVHLTGHRMHVGGVAFYSALWSEIEPTGGKAEWIFSGQSGNGKGYGLREPDAFKRREPGGTGAQT